MIRRSAYVDLPDDRHPRDRSRQPPPSAGHVYRCEGFRLVLSVVTGVASVVGGVVTLVVGLMVEELPAQLWGPLFIGIGCVGVFFGVWTPHRVVLDDSGALLQAVVRRIHISWDELESIGSPWWDVNHETLRWQRKRGLAVSTLQAFPDLHRMLVEIERRSPLTHVRS
jgi:hypothetical protein